jgi:hypothetical protein
MEDPIAFYKRARIHKTLGNKLEAMADLENYIRFSDDLCLIEEAKREIVALARVSNPSGDV